MSTKEYVYNHRLRELHNSGYEMVNGEPDIRDWRVVAGAHLEIGRVKELLFDESSGRIRYVVVDLDGKPLGLLSRTILVPIGLAQLHRREKLVVFPGLTVGHIASLPAYENGKISTETERSVRAVFAPTAGLQYLDEDYVETEPVYESESIRDTEAYRPARTAVAKSSVKEEIQENIEKMKESVRKMESEVEKLGKNEI